MKPCELESCVEKAVIKRGKDGRAVCKKCFIELFEQDVHDTIVKEKLFTRGDKVAIGASGGKDSTVLAYVVKTLNDKYDYGLNIFLLSIDEGIKGYRDDSLEAVEKNRIEYGLPLKIVSYEELYGWTMDKVVENIGKKNNCTYCGVFRRKALDRGAELIGANKLVTGHNADDMAETVLMNILRGDVARLGRCTNAITGDENELPRVKPLKFCFEKDIVFYARLQNLEYFYTECIYAPNSYRNFARNYIKQLERLQPRAILDLIHSGETVAIRKEASTQIQTNCTRCGYMSSQPICKACLLLEGLNTGNYQIGNSSKKKPREPTTETNSMTGENPAPEKSTSGCGGQCACEAKGLNGLDI